MKNHAVAIFLGALATPAVAGMITWGPSSWVTNEGGSPNYVLSISGEGTNIWQFDFAIDPWNAEALNLYLDFGEVTMGSVGILGNSSVSVVTDTNQDNLQGLKPPLYSPDLDWELAFSLGSTGYEGIQSFSWQLSGTTLSSIEWQGGWLAGARAQVFCSGSDLLPTASQSCNDSDKSYGYGVYGGGVTSVSNVPLPATAWLFATGVAALMGVRAKKRAAPNPGNA